MFKQSMTMAQQRITILRILEAGKKSVDEATELLEATEQPAQSDQPRYHEAQAAPPGELTSAPSTPPVPKEISASEIKLDRMAQMQVQGVTPEFIETMRDLGLTGLSTDRLVQMRLHGVTPVFVEEMRAAALYPTVGQLIEMRIHGVTPDYVRRKEALYQQGLPNDRLIEMPIHDVDAQNLRTMQKLA